MKPPIDYGRLAFERQEAIDTLHRFTAGLDTGDAGLLGSAFTADAVVDLTGTARKVGVQFPVLRGRDAIVATLTAVVGPLDTSHTTSNHQVEVEGESATLTAYVMAQHYLPGCGPDPGSTEHALFMNRYDTALAREDDLWGFTRIAVHTLWFDGDPGVALNGAAAASA